MARHDRTPRLPSAVRATGRKVRSARPRQDPAASWTAGRGVAMTAGMAVPSPPARDLLHLPPGWLRRLCRLATRTPRRRLTMAEKCGDSLRRSSALPRGAAQHRHEADLLVGVVAEGAREMRGHGERARLFHPAQRHAHVLGL